MNFILCRKKTRLSRDKVSDTISRLTHTCDTNSIQFFFQMESNIRGDVQLQNFWKHLWKDRYCIRSIPSSHAHIKLFSATTRKTGVSSLLSRRRSRDFSTMIRAGRKSRRQVTHGVTYISTESNRIDGKASLRRNGSCPLRGTAVIYRYVKHGEAGSPVSESLRAASCCVYAHVTSVTKLLINAILSRRWNYAIDPQLTSIRPRVLSAEYFLSPELKYSGYRLTGSTIYSEWKI